MVEDYGEVGDCGSREGDWSGSEISNIEFTVELNGKISQDMFCESVDHGIFKI
jgi:hypothetical protein